MSLLIIGGTGTLGRQIVRQALDEGYEVKCLVRNLRRTVFLRDWGAELIYGDLSLPATIPAALKGVRVIIDASTVRPTDDYNAARIDWRGKIALLEAAKVANVKSFLFFSFLGAKEHSTIPLLDLKLKFMERLKSSGIKSTVFECAGFFQGLIDQYAIPTLEKQTIWLVNNIPPTPYIDSQDAAKIVISSLKNNNSEKYSIYSLVGPKLWAPEQIIQLCERLSGEKAKISYLPLSILTLLRNILRSFEFTWNISDRLHFSELLNNSTNSKVVITSSSENNLQTLERYLQEYFSKILKKLKETNYQQSQKNNDISFL